jgi:putative endonuclease
MGTMKPWLVYILRCADDTLYCGITNDLPRRIARHNAGTASRYTRSRTPVNLVASVEAPTKGDALRLEMAVKKRPRKDKILFLQAHGKKPPELANRDTSR